MDNYCKTVICVFWSQISPVLLFLQVALSASLSGSTDSNITMEIPIDTTIAYSLMTLAIKQDGTFREKLLCDL